jgi:hypothetical protein
MTTALPCYICWRHQLTLLHWESAGDNWVNPPSQFGEFIRESKNTGVASRLNSFVFITQLPPPHKRYKWCLSNEVNCIATVFIHTRCGQNQMHRWNILIRRDLERFCNNKYLRDTYFLSACLRTMPELWWWWAILSLHSPGLQKVGGK